MTYMTLMVFDPLSSWLVDLWPFACIYRTQLKIRSVYFAFLVNKDQRYYRRVNTK